MNKSKPTFLKSYAFSLILIGSIAAGSIIGLIFKEKAAALKPLGDIFLNLLFTVVAPVVFFSIASAVASTSDIRRLGKILSLMLGIFVATSVVSSLLMIGAVKMFPVVQQGIPIEIFDGYQPQQINVPQQIVKAITVPDFPELFSKKNMLALIVFSMLIGFAASLSGEKGKPFVHFLQSAKVVLEKPWP
jgi:Na+/H+-dicarboxylate symporter